MLTQVGSALIAATSLAALSLWSGAIQPSAQEGTTDAGRSAADLAAVREAFRRVAADPYPPENPYTPEKADLGQRLFFDPILSGSGRMACASCHDPARSWTDGRRLAVGDAGLPMKVRTPTLLDLTESPILGWDGKFRDLEAVAFTPITGATAMNLPEAEALSRLRAEADYVRAFAVAFSDGAVSRRNVELALATYQRSIVSEDAPFDRWVAGDESAIGPRAKAGFGLFTGKARCAECHSGASFTDGSFHDIGVGTGDDIGRAALFPASRMLRYAFKTPTLREVSERGPYMHDGSRATLREVLDLYDRGGIDRPSRSPDIRPLGLSAAEKNDLLAFLETLSADPPSGNRSRSN